MSVDFGDGDVRMAILYGEVSEVIRGGFPNVTNLVSLRGRHSLRRFAKQSPGNHSWGYSISVIAGIDGC
jgi:hypothetical protein